MSAAFGWGLLAASSLVIGAVIAFLVRIPLRVIGLIMGFGAGVLISAVAFDLVEEAAEKSSGNGWVAAGLFAGCAVFFLGVEIGVEHVSTAEIDLEAGVVASHAEAFDGPAVSAEAAIAQAVALAFRSVEPARLDRCEGLGVSLPVVGIGLLSVLETPALAEEIFAVVIAVFGHRRRCPATAGSPGRNLTENYKGRCRR